MNYKRRTHKKRHNKKNKKYTHKRRQYKGGRMTTTVDTNPISYRDDEYKEMNELAFKGGLNTPESQGPMTLDELNISGISSGNNTNDQLFTEYQENNISGFAQDEDEGWEDQLNQIMQENNNQQNHNPELWEDSLASDEQAYTEMESYPSFGNQSTISSISTNGTMISELTNDTMVSDMSMGGKKKKRHTNKKKKYINKKRTSRKYKK